MDSYRRNRSPGSAPDRTRGGDRYAPRERGGPGDSYVPSSTRPTRPRSRSPSYRRRSRSPPPRGDSWRSRPRSPPPARRYDTYSAPRGDSYRGSGYGYDDRSARDRSPPPSKRGREPSPRSARSPPPAKRERPSSPSRDYGRNRRYGNPLESIELPVRPVLDSTANVALLDEAIPYFETSCPTENLNINLELNMGTNLYSSPRRYSPARNYRPRSRTPPRHDARPGPYEASSWRRRSPSPRNASGRNSVVSSRRSSPRGYDRRRPVENYDAEEPRGQAYRTSRANSPRARSPRRPRSPYRESAAYDDRTAERDTAKLDREYSNGADAYATPREDDYRDRAPPTGPSASRNYSAAGSPPAGPSGTPGPTGYGRPTSSSQGPPSGPRDYSGGYRGRGAPRGGFSRGRGGPSTWAPNPGYGRGGARESYYEPRGGSAVTGRGTFRSNNSSSKTYPMTQRFNVQSQLSDLAQVKEGGEKLPALYDSSKADRLEEEAARLRKLIDDKEASKRQAMNEWDNVQREVKASQYRTEMAEEHARELAGESEASAAF